MRQWSAQNQQAFVSMVYLNFLYRKKETEAVVLIGYATLTEEEIKEALQILSRIWKKEY